MRCDGYVMGYLAGYVIVYIYINLYAYIERVKRTHIL